MDYGYPQFTEAPILQEFIKTDSYRMEVRQLEASLGSRLRGSISSRLSGGLQDSCLQHVAGWCVAGWGAWQDSNVLHGVGFVQGGSHRLLRSSCWWGCAVLQPCV
jgi:hypothetical protein